LGLIVLSNLGQQAQMKFPSNSQNK